MVLKCWANFFSNSFDKHNLYAFLSTSIADHMSNIRSKLFARDSACNFSFSCIKRGFVELQNKQKYQTQSHSNLWFHSNMILFFLFGNYLVTMIPLLWIGFSVSFKLLLLFYIFVSFLDKQISYKQWKVRRIIDTDYSLNTWKYYMLFPKT